MSSDDDDSAATNQLLERAAAGDERAVEELFDRHLPKIQRSLQRRLRPETLSRFDLSDVVQETHNVARRRLADFLVRRPMPFSLWLLRSAHQQLVDLERRHLYADKRSLLREIPLPDHSSMELAQRLLGERPSPVEQSIQRERTQIVRRCLAQLDPLDRDVLLLRMFDTLTSEQVAVVLSIHPETARKRFTRCLLKLRRLLLAAGFDEE